MTLKQTSASFEFTNLTDKPVAAGVIISMTVSAHDGSGEVVDMFGVDLAPGETKVVNGKSALAMGEYDYGWVEQYSGDKNSVVTNGYEGTLKITNN